MGNNLIHNYLNNPNNYVQSQKQSHPASKGGASAMPTMSTAMNSFDVQTDKLVKPLDGKGHLVDGGLVHMPKEFVRDTVYTTKALADGARGKANDHQLGKLNDLGLKLGGVAIATYLMTRKTTPKTKAMEFVGFGAFLASMAIWPKVALEIPARIIHGFNFRKQYIDEQGRKKYVSQDPNYIPFDLYKGDKKSEDLDVIGDRAGIKRDIPNRHEAVKDHMRKVSVQNNTLWMLTAGIATPLMTALACNKAESLLTAPLEKRGNKKANASIDKVTQYFTELQKIDNNTKLDDAKKLEQKNELLTKTFGVKPDAPTQTSALLDQYRGKTLNTGDIDKLADTLADGFDAEMKDAAKADIKDLISGERYIANNQSAQKLTKSIHSTIKAADAGLAETLTEKEIGKAVSEGIIRGAVRDMMTSVADDILAQRPNAKDFNHDFITTNFRSKGIEDFNFFEVAEGTEKMTPEERLAHNIKSVVLKVNNGNPSEDFVSGMSALEHGNNDVYKEVYSALDKKSAEIAHAFYTGELGITGDREKFIRTSVGKLYRSKAADDAAHRKLYGDIGEILTEDAASHRGYMINDSAAKKIKTAAKGISRYNAVDQVLTDAAHFKVEKANETIIANNWDEVSKTFIKELGITDKELATASKDKALSNKLLAEKLEKVCSNEETYNSFITKLAGKMAELDEKLDTPNDGSEKSMMGDLENGIRKNCDRAGDRLRKLGFGHMTDKMVGVHDGKLGMDDAGSIKNSKIERIHSRVDGVRNSYARLLQTAEFFHRADGYQKATSVKGCDMAAVARKFGMTENHKTNLKIIEDGKKLLLDAHTSDYYNKMGLHNNKSYFKTLMWSVFRPNKDTAVWNENWAQSTLDTVKTLNGVQVNGNTPRRVFEGSRKGLGTKLMEQMNQLYSSFGSIARSIRDNCENIVTDGSVSAKDQRACKRFDTLGKATNDFFHDTIKQMSNSKKWMKTFAPILGGTFLATVGAQFFFGKKDPDIKA